MRHDRPIVIVWSVRTSCNAFAVDLMGMTGPALMAVKIAGSTVFWHLLFRSGAAAPPSPATIV
jgi:hypothetical protein